MGEIAEMMLSGVLCEACGSYLGEGTGFPGYCSRSCAQDRGWTAPPMRSGKAQKRAAQAAGDPIGAKRRRWLEAAARTAGPNELYDGIRLDMAPGVFRKLEAMGFVRIEQPHNDVHKPRAVITDAGRAKLAGTA